MPSERVIATAFLIMHGSKPNYSTKQAQFNVHTHVADVMQWAERVSGSYAVERVQLQYDTSDAERS